MAARQEWFTAQQLVALPGMPTTDRGVRLLAEKNLVVTRRKLRGKGLEYSRDSLPVATREHLEQLDTDAVLRELGIDPHDASGAARGAQAAAAETVNQSVNPSAHSLTTAQPGLPGEGAPEPAPRKKGHPSRRAPAAPAGAAQPAAGALVAQPAAGLPAVASPAAAQTTAAQREVELARTLVIGELRALARAQGGSLRRAAQQLLERARAGELRPAIRAKLELACDARGRSAAEDDGLPSAVTLQRWDRALRAGTGLAPRASAHIALAIRPWYRAFFALTDRMQKPDLKSCHAQLVAAWRPEWADAPGAAAPSYDACWRAYNKRSGLDRLKGRHSGSALRARTFYHQRTYEGIAPFTEVHADGWTTHFTAPHPVTGAFCTYEVWHFHDVATRYVTPLAIGLSENTDTILEGLHQCIRVGGQIAIWQTDHTSSVKNRAVMDEHAGLADRLGLTVVHPLAVGNSQANGIPENFNTWLDRQARELATYQHPNRMDSGTFTRIRRITNAMVRAAKPEEREALRAKAMQMGKGIVFDTHAAAVAWLQGLVAKWNRKPHRSLPKLRDAAGRLTHMTPQQSLDAAIAAGWEPLRLPDAVLEDQFRPHLRKTVTRGCVTPFNGQRYSHAELRHLEGQEVLVAIDREDPSAVNVKDLQGRLLVRCDLVAAVHGRTQSMREHTELKRADARIRLRERQIDAIEQGIAPPVIDALAAPAFEVGLADLEMPFTWRHAEPEPLMLDTLETTEFIKRTARETQAKQACAAAAAALQASNEDREGGAQPDDERDAEGAGQMKVAAG